MTRQLYDGYGVNYGDYYYNSHIQTPPFRRGTLPGAAGAAANQQIFFKHQPRKSPRKSPRRSPRKSPRRSPRKSPRRSPRRSPEHARQLEMIRRNQEFMASNGGSIYARKSPKKISKKVQFFLQNAEQMGVDPEYVKRFR